MSVQCSQHDPAYTTPTSLASYQSRLHQRALFHWRVSKWPNILCRAINTGVCVCYWCSSLMMCLAIACIALNFIERNVSTIKFIKSFVTFTACLFFHPSRTWPVVSLALKNNEVYKSCHLPVTECAYSQWFCDHAVLRQETGPSSMDHPLNSSIVWSFVGWFSWHCPLFCPSMKQLIFQCVWSI